MGQMCVRPLYGHRPLGLPVNPCLYSFNRILMFANQCSDFMLRLPTSCTHVQKETFDGVPEHGFRSETGGYPPFHPRTQTAKAGNIDVAYEHNRFAVCGRPVAFWPPPVCKFIFSLAAIPTSKHNPCAGKPRSPKRSPLLR